jgi:thymidylate kinase
MEDYLNNIGLRLETQPGKKISVYVINNIDGSPRWIWNAQNPNPDFLRLYTVSSARANFFSLAMKFIFFLKLQHLVFMKNSLSVSPDPDHVLGPYTSGHFALFTGTPGPNRKLVLFAKQQFVKIALNSASAELIDNEMRNLTQIKSGQYAEIPQATKIEQGIVALSDLGAGGKRMNTFSKLHAQALLEFYNQNHIVFMTLEQSDIFQKYKSIQEPTLGLSSVKIPRYLKEKVNILAERAAPKGLYFNWAHGDFTPWNCFVSSGKINLYDFELAQQQIPFGFDAFHFVMQQGVLVDRLPWRQIKPLLKAAFDELCLVSGNDNNLFDDYLEAYLVINTAYHIELYGNQEHWHEQVQWLLHTWDDALSDLLKAEMEPRSLLIGDVFDVLQNQDYAAIKIPNIDPRHISSNTDIDLLLNHATAKTLYQYLENHSLVKTVHKNAQSNMMSLMVVLHNGQLLALDLIWQLKVKALDFLDAPKALKAAVQNDFGIKILTQKDLQTYIRHFYGLNGSPIPNKYLTFFEDTSDVQLNYREMKVQLKKMPANKGLAAWKNKFDYAIDVLLKLRYQKGMIITFSGVDGAGKSTVIEHAKTILEKKMRKKVVVIRHRPSILPILSAIMHDKAKAEQKAASELPRQGTNKNTISSLLRFGYYYTDYLFGQFYVHLKYVMRGDIVLYDRYYFDFINDSLRSNIRLPKWLTKTGYKLLFTPQINFFLYANADTILSRKKELDEHTIVALTKSYLDLFTELEAKSEGRYYAIENLLLEQTLDQISTVITAKIYAA